MAFTLTVVAYIDVLASGRGAVPPPWLIYSPLLLLVLLMLSGGYLGVYLFGLPNLARRRGVGGGLTDECGAMNRTPRAERPDSSSAPIKST